MRTPLTPGRLGRSRLAALIAVLAVVATCSVWSSDAAAPNGYTAMTSYVVANNVSVAANKSLTKVVTGGVTPVPSFVGSVQLSVKVVGGTTAGDLQVYPNGIPDSDVDLSWAARQTVTGTILVDVGQKNSITLVNKSSAAVHVTLAITAYDGHGEAGPQGDPGPTGPQGPAGQTSKDLRFSANTTSNGPQITFGGYTYQAICSVTASGTDLLARVQILFTGPSGTTVTAWGLMQTQDEDTGALTPYVYNKVAATSSGTLAVYQTNKLTRGYVNPLHITASDGTSQDLFLRFSANARTTPGVGESRCQVSGSIMSNN